MHSVSVPMVNLVSNTPSIVAHSLIFIPEYWIASLKVITIVAFILTGVLVNAGVNVTHHYIGFHNWTIKGAPFVGGFGGFARVFVTASFACMSFPLFQYVYS